MMRRLLRPALLGGALLLPGAAGHAVSFTPLGEVPGGPFSSQAEAISADGSVVVGHGIYEDQVFDSNSEAFRWDAGSGLVGLGDLAGGHPTSAAFDVSADGSLVVGVGRSDAGNEAATWTAAGGWQGLGDLDGGSFNSRAFAVSGDGTFAVGRASSDAGTEAFLWDAANGLQGLGDLAGGDFHSSAYAVSADGSVVVGGGDSSTDSLENEAFRWTAGGGMQGLGDLPGGSVRSRARDVSADGSVVVGFGTPDALGIRAREAFRWDATNGMQGLGDLAGGDFRSQAHAISPDGSVVVGQGRSGSGDEAFVWDESHGMRSLPELLEAGGVDLSGWQLEAATGVSADGRTIVGYGSNPNGDREAFRAVIPEPSTALLVGVGLTGLALGWRRG